MAKAAALMTGTELLPSRVLGTAWPQHFNKTVAEITWANIQKVGMPTWSDADQTLAKALQKELGSRETGLALTLPKELQGPVTDNRGGGSDDIGDISWNVPTVTLRYPANIPGLPGHNWANAIAMATPIAHKGTTAGAKVQAMTMLDLLLRPELVTQAWDYFRTVQTKDQKYEPLLRARRQAGDRVEQGRRWIATGRRCGSTTTIPTRYKTYLEQLGIAYPTVKKRLSGRGRGRDSPGSGLANLQSSLEPIRVRRSSRSAGCDDFGPLVRRDSPRAREPANPRTPTA